MLKSAYIVFFVMIVVVDSIKNSIIILIYFQRNIILEIQLKKKNFSYVSGLSRHRSGCKEKEDISKIDYLETEMKELQKKNLELSNKIKNIEKSKNNNTNIQKQIVEKQNYNIVNQTNNNNTTINYFGNETLDFITDTVILHCMNKIYGSIPLLLEKIHFNPEHPENYNIQIPNKKLPHAKIMNNKKEWQIVKRKDAIDSMINNGYTILDDKFQET